MTNTSETKVIQSGPAVVIYSSYERGEVIISWNGRSRVILQHYSPNDNVKVANQFIGWFLEATSNFLILLNRDDQPRGFGRVVNFSPASERWGSDQSNIDEESSCREEFGDIEAEEV